MSRNLVLSLVVIVIVVAFGGWLLTQKQYRAPTPQPQVSPSPVSETASTPSASIGEQENVVKIGAKGFSPQNITVKAGGSAVFKNEDTASHQVNSAVHPTHLLYPPLNTVGLLKSGESKSLAFPDKGTYRYHDHLNPSLTGQVSVE